jgi:sulfatase modifying factor 1
MEPAPENTNTTHDLILVVLSTWSLSARFQLMSRFMVRLSLFVVIGAFVPRAASAVAIAWSTVGVPGNAADALTGFGAVPYVYRIGTYDVTNSQYVDFLNAVDSTGADPLDLYNENMGNADFHGGINNTGPAGSVYSVIPGSGNHPVNYVSWFDSIRFANWLNNGQGTASTETGAYTLLGGTPIPSNGDRIVRNAGAQVFLPSENEWYKAAYFNEIKLAPGYFLYPTKSNVAPHPSVPTLFPNSANYFNAVIDPTNVGAYAFTTSPSGAFDMGGNVFQWTESLANVLSRVFRGGSFVENSTALHSSFRAFDRPYVEYSTIGFRMASVPEPNATAIAALGGLSLLALRWRRN